MPIKEKHKLWEKLKETGKPNLMDSAVLLLDKILTSDSYVLEFGSGMSTIWFARRVRQVISYENNIGWFERISKLLIEKKLSTPHILVYDPSYPEKGYSGENRSYDLIFDDGRGREICAKTSVSFLKQGGYIVLDDANREKYKPIVNFLDSLGWEKTEMYGKKQGPKTMKNTATFFWRRT